MARLTGKTVAEVQENRLETAQEAARELRAVIVLKGAHTLIAAPDTAVSVNLTGNAGMARGGSGDLLAGMIASFAAQGMPPFQAAVSGVHLHGLAGDRTAERLSMQGMLPSDMLQELPMLLNLNAERWSAYEDLDPLGCGGHSSHDADVPAVRLRDTAFRFGDSVHPGCFFLQSTDSV